MVRRCRYHGRRLAGPAVSQLEAVARFKIQLPSAGCQAGIDGLMDQRTGHVDADRRVERAPAGRLLSALLGESALRRPLLDSPCDVAGSGQRTEVNISAHFCREAGMGKLKVFAGSEQRKTPYKPRAVE